MGVDDFPHRGVHFVECGREWDAADVRLFLVDKEGGSGDLFRSCFLFFHAGLRETSFLELTFKVFYRVVGISLVGAYLPCSKELAIWNIGYMLRRMVGGMVKICVPICWFTIQAGL